MLCDQNACDRKSSRAENGLLVKRDSREKHHKTVLRRARIDLTSFRRSYLKSRRETSVCPNLMTVVHTDESIVFKSSALTSH